MKILYLQSNLIPKIGESCYPHDITIVIPICPLSEQPHADLFAVFGLSIKKRNLLVFDRQFSRLWLTNYERFSLFCKLYFIMNYGLSKLLNIVEMMYVIWPVDTLKAETLK